LNFNGADSFQYTVRDGAGGFTNGTVSVQVTPVNDAPVAHDQSATTPEETAKVISLGASDLETASLTRIIVSGPAHGSLGPITGSEVTYTPDLNYTGPDTFRFKVNDGGLDSATATVTLNVTPVNDVPVAQDVSRTFAEDTRETITLPATDVDGDTLSYSVLSQTNGFVIVEGNLATFVPAQNYHGPASFTFRATDGPTESNVATASLTITPVNDRPSAVNDETTVGEDDPFTVVDVLDNDSDVDGDTRTVVAVSDPPNGTARLVGGVVEYKPDADFNGEDAFTYTLTDGDETTAVPGRVDVTVTSVNDAPVADEDESVTIEGTPRSIDVLANDDDVDGDELGILSATGATKGTTTVGDDNRVHYTPNAGQVGIDTFTYAVSDGDLTDTATVTIEILAAGSGGEVRAGLADAQITEGNSGEQTLDVVVSLSRPAVVPVEVRVSTNAGTATSNVDYGALNNQLVDVFAPGESQKTVSLKIKGDTLPEANETLTLVVVSTSGAVLGNGTATITILDDDTDPSLSIASVDVTEGNSGSQTALLGVVLSRSSGKTVAVDYASADVIPGAQAGLDYTPTSGRLTFAPGELSKTIALSIHGDSDVELDERLTVQLSNAANAGLAAPLGTVTIVNDDSLLPLPPPPPPVPPLPTADLALTITGPATSAVDQAATYEIRVRNNGPDQATGVVVSDHLGAGMQFVSASVGLIACTAGQPVVCPVGNLANGAAATITVVATTLEPGVHANTASVTGQQPDPAAGNNSATATTRVPVPVVREPQQRASGCDINGTPGDDVLRGTARGERICGRGGNDVILGRGGNDILLGGLGADRIYGGDGNDILKGQNGPDALFGGSGNDRIDGGRGRDQLAGDRGADHLLGSFGDDFLNGGKGKDKTLGGPGDDRMRRDALDTQHGGPGKDRCVQSGATRKC
jgi:uncharacterized repeat protein (TIGR01451 family)